QSLKHRARLLACLASPRGRDRSSGHTKSRELHCTASLRRQSLVQRSIYRVLLLLLQQRVDAAAAVNVTQRNERKKERVTDWRAIRCPSVVSRFFFKRRSVVRSVSAGHWSVSSQMVNNGQVPDRIDLQLLDINRSRQTQGN